MDINFNGKLGVLFAPKTTFLVIFPTFSMLNLKKHQIWVPWVITKILMCHMPGFDFSSDPATQLYHYPEINFYQSQENHPVVIDICWTSFWDFLSIIDDSCSLKNMFYIYLYPWKFLLKPLTLLKIFWIMENPEHNSNRNHKGCLPKKKSPYGGTLSQPHITPSPPSKVGTKIVGTFFGF